MRRAFSVQFMDYGTGALMRNGRGKHKPEATQGHAVESKLRLQELGSWGDLAGSVWLYNRTKETCKDGRLDLVYTGLGYL